MDATNNLESLSRDRDNNFNLLRFGAACAVILGHCILLGGDRNSALGWSLGYAAVNGFFVISGFLVCRSLLTRRTLRAYFAGRLLRIYPALIPVVLLCVFGLGVWQSPVATDVFLSHSQTQRFLWHNSLLLVGEVEVRLPGLFPQSPFPGQVNAPLWTLQYELGMYLVLAAAWVLSRMAPEDGTGPLFRRIVLVMAATSMIGFLANVSGSNPSTGMAASALRFSAMFFGGAACYLWRHRIRLSWAGGALLTCLIAVSIQARPLFVVLAWLSLPYLLLLLAYLPRGPVRLFNRLGDYSYGLYIIAFPIQQILVTHWPDIGIARLFLLTMLMTLPLAMASWHFVEKPALSLKARLRRAHSSAETIR